MIEACNIASMWITASVGQWRGVMNRLSIVIILCGAAGIAAPTLGSAPQFKGMGKPPPGLYGQLPVIGIGVCGDFGEVGGSNFGDAVLWHPEGGYQSLLSSTLGQSGYITGFVSDKATPVGTASFNDWPRPVRWPDRGGPPVPIPGFRADEWYAYSNAVYANADGTMIVGQMAHQISKAPGLFIWRAGVRKAKGWEFITQFPPGKSNVAFVDLSSYASIAVGGSVGFGAPTFEAMRWSKATGFVFDGDLPGGDLESLYGATNATGTVAVGFGNPGFPNYAAVRWTARSGIVRMDDSLPPPLVNLSTGFGDTDDSGFVHVGGVSQVAIDGALLWNPLDGMVSAKDLLVNTYGLTAAAGWDLTSIEAISPNGRFVVGKGLNPAGGLETWWAEIRPFCYADCDRASTPKGGEPVLNVDDYICYLSPFVMDALYANCNNDAELDVNDFICFQTKFVLGC